MQQKSEVRRDSKELPKESTHNSNIDDDTAGQVPLVYEEADFFDIIKESPGYSDER